MTVQPQAEQHGRADADDLLDVAVDAEPHDDPVQRHRNDDGLETQRDRRRDVEMRRVLHKACQATDSDRTMACSAKMLSSANMRSW